MKRPATESNVIAIDIPQEQSLSLRIDEQLHGEAREYLRAGLQGSVNSQRAFATDVRQYVDWCEHNGYEPTPLLAVVLVEYVTFLGRTRSFEFDFSEESLRDLVQFDLAELLNALI